MRKSTETIWLGKFEKVFWSRSLILLVKVWISGTKFMRNAIIKFFICFHFCLFHFFYINKSFVHFHQLSSLWCAPGINLSPLPPFFNPLYCLCNVYISREPNHVNCYLFKNSQDLIFRHLFLISLIHSVIDLWLWLFSFLFFIVDQFDRKLCDFFRIFFFLFLFRCHVNAFFIFRMLMSSDDEKVIFEIYNDS